MSSKPAPPSWRRRLLRWFVRGLAELRLLALDECRDAELSRSGYYYCARCHCSHPNGTTPCKDYERSTAGRQ